MRVVIDPNIFLGACLGAGASNEVINACLKNQLHPVMGEALVNEYEDVLSREHLFESSRLSAPERAALLDIFLAKCEWVRIYYSWRPNLRDEADNHLIELAVAGAANLVITRNLRDFRSTELRFDGILVRDPDFVIKEYGL